MSHNQPTPHHHPPHQYPRTLPHPSLPTHKPKKSNKATRHPTTQQRTYNTDTTPTLTAEIPSTKADHVSHSRHIPLPTQIHNTNINTSKLKTFCTVSHYQKRLDRNRLEEFILLDHSNSNSIQYLVPRFCVSEMTAYLFAAIIG